ncbi:hypothetical protein LGW44_06775, partial [Streptococcus mutans]|nr:hypothetical protein [Streptococcus mutans]
RQSFFMRLSLGSNLPSGRNSEASATFITAESSRLGLASLANQCHLNWLLQNFKTYMYRQTYYFFKLYKLKLFPY